MAKRAALFANAVLFLGMTANLARAQSAKKPVAPDFAASAQHGVELASRGHCTEALPLLRKSAAQLADKKARYDAALAMAQCGMSVDNEAAAVEGLLILRRDFPRDPKVLYTATHFYSELASRAAQELAATAPASAEALELDAEARESQGKWDEAAAEYKKILEKYPNQPGIHYRLGRILLSQPATPETAEEARKEFEAELQLDPDAASAEFMLGDLARQASQWDEAIKRFSRAAQLDAGFSEAYLGLGMALNAAGKNADAVSPLEKYVKMEPDDPAGHYQLAIAYSRTGRKQDADRELALQRKAQEAQRSAPHPQNPYSQ
ncbi:MAG TPA: tetratricopeptide repeat protein [Candidatus Acidoferrales bacterium]|nr:tetratricopeptide repeat protein [Candidatus Acidoferrales bacterium]